MPEFAVIDVETTGLSPAHQHRVVEVAVVVVNGDGRVVHSWDTLVNPQRDVGATDVHGLTAADLVDAPLFQDIAGELSELLEGRVPVAHNWPFEAGFLTAEYHRLGVHVPVDAKSGLCTMQMAPYYLAARERSLAACCELIGYPLRQTHQALVDAQATAALLTHYMKRDGGLFERRWRPIIDRALRGQWPRWPGGAGRSLSRGRHRRGSPEHFLARLSARAPKPIVHDEIAPYIDALDRALLNRHISRHEANELVSIATSLGLSRQDALALHRLYVRALCVQALADGIVTAQERADLHKVAHLLGLAQHEVEAALREAAAARETETTDGLPAHKVGGFRLQPGDRIAFTGEPSGVSRAQLEARSQRAGLRVTSGVSRFTKLVVAADTDSLSGKARRARELGVAIVDVQTFLRMLSELEEAAPPETCGEAR